MFLQSKRDQKTDSKKIVLGKGRGEGRMFSVSVSWYNSMVPPTADTPVCGSSEWKCSLSDTTAPQLHTATSYYFIIQMDVISILTQETLQWELYGIMSGCCRPTPFLLFITQLDNFVAPPLAQTQWLVLLSVKCSLGAARGHSLLSSLGTTGEKHRGGDRSAHLQQFQLRLALRICLHRWCKHIPALLSTP